MTFAFNGFSGSNSALQQAVPIRSPTHNRKRKDVGDEDNDRDQPLERQTGIKGIRRLANVPHDGNDDALFHPLPADLNMQLLANLGYIQSSQQMTQWTPDFAPIRATHSPTSSFSDFTGPATPSDMAGSAESYFSKGMRRESEPAYPDFKIYPDERQASGLLGMNMQPTSVQSSDGMDMDEAHSSSPNLHGYVYSPVHDPLLTSLFRPQCKSIPQLHVRSEPGIYSELWAKCPDCGSMSKVDSPAIGDSLSYSP